MRSNIHADSCCISVAGLQSGKAGASSSCTDWDMIRKLAVQEWQAMSFEAKASFKATWEKAHQCEPLKDTWPQKPASQPLHSGVMSISLWNYASCMHVVNLPGIMEKRKVR